MRRLITCAVLAASAAFLLAASAGSAARSQIAFVVADAQHDLIVEQQSPGWPTATPELWVNNPTPCAWDVDDNVNYAVFSGTLSAGTSVSTSNCVIAEADQSSGSRHVAILVTAKSDALVVSITVGSQHTVVSPMARDHEYDYTDCFSVVAENEQAIPGSNGGHGQHYDVTFTIENPTGHLAKPVSAMALVGNPGPNDPYGC